MDSSCRNQNSGRLYLRYSKRSFYYFWQSSEWNIDLDSGAYIGEQELMVFVNEIEVENSDKCAPENTSKLNNTQYQKTMSWEYSSLLPPQPRGGNTLREKTHIFGELYMLQQPCLISKVYREERAK